MARENLVGCLWRSQLTQLIQRGLANSPTLAAAQARIAHAQAVAEFGRAANLPQINAGADISYGLQSGNYIMPPPPLGKGGQYVSQGQATVNFSADLDFWGRNAALIRSAEAQLKAAQFDRDAAHLALATSIARAYAQLAGQYDMQNVLLATLRQRQEIRKLVSQRVVNGLDTQLEVRQADTNAAALRIELEQLATAIKITRQQLATLTGDMPASAEKISRPVMRPLPFSVPANLSFDLLAHRPELAAQRARILAAISEEDAAKAQFYPSINLNALIGFQAIGLGQLFSADNQANNIGPAIIPMCSALPRAYRK